MAMKVRYTVVNGQVMSENRGGVERDYIPDALGNTIALMDSTGTKTDTFTYFPFGNVASRTGTTATPFQWVGGSGYFQDSTSRTYVRARTMYTSIGRWGMQDPLDFDAGDYNLYRYAGNRLVTWTDSSGMETPVSCWSRTYMDYVRNLGLDPRSACRQANKERGYYQPCDNPPNVPPKPILPPPPAPECPPNRGTPDTGRPNGGIPPWVGPGIALAGLAFLPEDVLAALGLAALGLAAKGLGKSGIGKMPKLGKPRRNLPKEGKPSKKHPDTDSDQLTNFCQLKWLSCIGHNILPILNPIVTLLFGDIAMPGEPSDWTGPIDAYQKLKDCNKEYEECILSTPIG